MPEANVEVPGLPTAVPWLKLSEAVDLMRAVSPRLAFPVHDAVLATPQIWYRQFDALKPAGTSFEATMPDGVVSGAGRRCFIQASSGDRPGSGQA